MSWYLKKEDDSQYGPIEINALRYWAEEGRILPGDSLSEDEKNWIPAPELSELAMNWVTVLADGAVCGPINLLATVELVHSGTITPDATVKHKQTGESRIVAEALLPLLIRRNGELRALLADVSQEPADVADISLGNDDQPSGTWTETVRRSDYYEKESGRWKGLYSEERKRSLSVEHNYKNQLQELREDALDDHKKYEQLKQRMGRMTRNHQKLKLVAEGTTVAPGTSATDYANLLESYQDLADTYDQLTKTFSKTGDSSSLAIDVYQEREKSLREIVANLEKQVEAAEEESRQAREALGILREAHLQLQLCYRDMNGRYIHLRQKVDELAGKQGVAGVAMVE